MFYGIVYRIRVRVSLRERGWVGRIVLVYVEILGLCFRSSIWIRSSAASGVLRMLLGFLGTVVTIMLAISLSVECTLCG